MERVPDDPAGGGPTYGTGACRTGGPAAYPWVDPGDRLRASSGQTGSGAGRTTGSGQPRCSGRPPRQWLAPWHILNFLPEPQGQGAFFGVPLSCSSVRVVPDATISRSSTPPSAVGAE